MGLRFAGLALAALFALGGCRGCGCDAPSDAPRGDVSAPVDPPAGGSAELAAEMGPDEVQRAITEGLRAVASRDTATAIARFEAAAAADPGRRVPQQRLCGLYRADGRLADALRACRAWHELEPEPEFKARARALVDALEAGGGTGP